MKWRGGAGGKKSSRRKTLAKDDLKEKVGCKE